MLKYAKVVNEATKACVVGIGTNIEFYKSVGMSLIDVEQGYDGIWYLVGYAPQKSSAEKIVEYEKQIEILNNKIVRDLIILNDRNSSAKDKEQAQTYFDNKMVEKNKLIEKINELKNSSKGDIK